MFARSKRFALMVLVVGLLGACRTDYMEQMHLIANVNNMKVTHLAADGDRLYIGGIINRLTFDQVREALEDNPEVDTLVLTAIHGSVDDETNIEMIRWLRDRKVRTHLLSNSAIASGAVDLWHGGVERTAEKGAMVGVHAWEGDPGDASKLPRDHPGHRLYADFVSDMLGNESFYWYTIEAAPADGMYWMKPEEIERFNLMTKAWLEPSNDPTPFGDDFLEEREEVLSDD